MEQNNQEQEPRPIKVVCLGKNSDLAYFSDSFYSFIKFLGTQNIWVGGILTLRGPGNKAFPPNLYSKRSECWIPESFLTSEETFGFTVPLFLLWFIGIYSVPLDSQSI